MIHELWSDRPSFKRLRFGRGLNIVLAARSGVVTETEDQGRTRNGAGKSSLIDILRFMLGGEVQKKKTIVAAPILKDDNFFLSFDLMQRPITVSRSPAGRGRVKVQGEFADWPIQPDINKKTGEVTMSGHVWTDLTRQSPFWLAGVREAVGIRRGAISGNMKVSFQAARSIG